ncbi:ABC transporter ATP-binding protein [Alkalibacterium pelagium]|uniref:Putative ABC transport system ATP-binding protein n=1 Tax=Alkalibacterium pelagium TaxID=426702 RepID=A0A1H7EV10_9LACT|nr:ATP-binding cassette domain-containing protein [Alkalibacterium pelagium]GEN49631.1 ABC transporter ATP-binding protein [Alkalibacterium pelagium]SEK17699.1 putative ABC transport system ATP-binding protein [Alkalibacterium pelagium]
MSDHQLEISNISFKTDSQSILESISFSVEKGERVTITGPSGGGKSTLLKIIGNIINPTDGKVLFHGENIQETDPLKYRQKVSYFFQNASLFDQTVRDNLSFPYDIRDEEFNEEKARDMLERVSLSRSYLDKPVNGLSGGEKQRVALIRNMMYLPEVLLLDEVTSSLDAENKEIIHKILNTLNKESGLTTLSVTHDENEISQADRVITIIDGRLEDSK